MGWQVKINLIIVLGIIGCANRDLVRVTRSAFNSPQIKVVSAKNSKSADYAVFFQQGFEQATDRMLQMDSLRRMAKGRLSELLGNDAVEKDTLNIAIGLPHAVNQSLERLKSFPNVMEALSAFSDGVNHFISQMDYLKPETLRLYRELANSRDYRPEPWSPIDSVAMAKAMTFFLSSALEEKLFFGFYGLLRFQTMLEDLPAQLAAHFDVRPIEPQFIVGNRHPVPKSARVTAFQQKSKLPEALTHSLLKVGCLNFGYPWPNCVRAGSVGSNSWVISSKIPEKTPGTSNGSSFLANDPHLPLTYPGTFYEQSLNSKEAGGTLHTAGLNVPGGPGVMIGHTDRMAWGFTNLSADVDDIYFEEISDDNASVKFGDRWVPLETEEVEFPVRLGNGLVERRKITLRWVNHTYTGKEKYRSHRRPIFSDHHRQLKTALDEFERTLFVKYAVSYRWVGQEGTTEQAMVYGLNHAQNVEEMRTAISLFEVGTQNVVYADRFGNIGYMAHGKFPVRHYLSKDYPPYVPILGHSDWDWDGYQTEIPQSENPKEGFIVTANNDPWGGSSDRFDYSNYLSYAFSTGVRAKRITTLIEESEKFDKFRMKQMQFDHYDLTSQRFLAQLRTQDLKVDGKSLDIANKLKNWDGMSSRNSIEPALWNNVLHALMKGFMDPEGKVELAAAMVEKNLSGDHKTQPKTQPKVFEMDRLTHSPMALKSLFYHLNSGLNVSDLGKARKGEMWKSALDSVAKAEGNWETKPWGESSRMTFTSPFAELLPKFAAFPIERDGSFDTIDVAHQSYGPNFRLIMEINESGITAENVMAVGNYNPTDERLYKELLLWRDGGYRPLAGF